MSCSLVNYLVRWDFWRWNELFGFYGFYDWMVDGRKNSKELFYLGSSLDADRSSIEGFLQHFDRSQYLSTCFTIDFYWIHNRGFRVITEAFCFVLDSFLFYSSIFLWCFVFASTHFFILYSIDCTTNHVVGFDISFVISFFQFVEAVWSWFYVYFLPLFLFTLHTSLHFLLHRDETVTYTAATCRNNCRNKCRCIRLSYIQNVPFVRPFPRGNKLSKVQTK